jgi:LmbE family N-acetylglucosaminyl deacetylase
MGARFLLSPHLDDAVLSCGGLIARWINRGYEVTVLTIFAGDPPPGPLSTYAQDLHSRWGQAEGAVASRRAEDRIACGRLGASVVHLAFPDAIYRRSALGEPLYPTEASILGGIQPEDDSLVEAILAAISQVYEPQATWLCPIGIGGHVDHRLTRRAAERLGIGLWYYRDLPYDSRGGSLPGEMGMPTGVEAVLGLAPEEIESWATAVAEYRSQVSSFWSDEAELLQELTEYTERMGGIRVFTPASEGQS